MNVNTAKKVLQLESDFTFDDARRRYRSLSKRYHPDNFKTGDKEKFIIINAAYNLLHADSLGLSHQDDIEDDMEQAISLQNEIEAFLDNVKDDYLGLRKILERDTNQYIREKINSAGSTSELKSVIKDDIAKYLTDVKVQLEHHLKKVEKNVRNDSSNFMFKLFNDMYVERRKYWLHTLYKNPVVIGEVFSLIFTFGVREVPAIREAFPEIFQIVSYWWFPIILILSGLLILGTQYIFLNPKRQFVPPSFSLAGLHQLVKLNSNSVSPTFGEVALGGAAIGAGIGSFVFPGVGTLVGGLVGSLLGFTGKSLDKQKREISENMCSEINNMFKKLDSILLQWIEHSKINIAKAAFDSFKKNINNISGYLTSKNETVKMLMEGKK